MKQLIRESLCDGCNGAKYGLPCNVEDRCEEFQKEIDLNDLVLRIILEVERSFNNLRLHGVHFLLAEWRQKKNILGMDIEVQSPEGVYQGRAIDISPFGQLVIELPNSNKVHIPTGTITLSKR